jgi:hypothetical protein
MVSALSIWRYRYWISQCGAAAIASEPAASEAINKVKKRIIVKTVE